MNYKNKSKSKCFWRVIVGVISTIITLEIQAAARHCCNLDTSTFIAAPSKEACDAMPNHVSVMGVTDPVVFQRAKPCFESGQREAADALKASGMGVPPGLVPPNLGAGGTPDIAAIMAGGGNQVAVQCCNMDSAEFSESASVEACLAQGDKFVPDTLEYIADAQVCRPSSGGGSAWEVEDFEDNIEGGDFEGWKDEHRPQGFAVYGVPPGMASQGKSIDMQTTFRSTDALTGHYSLRLKNFDFLSVVPARERAMASSLLGKNSPAAPGGVFSCEEPCATESGAGALPGMAGASQMFGTLGAKNIQSHVCAAYKGYIDPRDELSVNIVVFAASDAAGGTNSSGAGVKNVFVDSSNEWVRFSLPLSSLGNEIPETAKVGIQTAIQPRGMMQQATTTGMVSGVSNATDLKFDSVHFCSPMDFMAFHPHVIAGNTTSKIPESEEEDKGVQTFVNLDNDDLDEFFDNEDKNGVTGDNELVRLRLELPKNSFGKVKMSAPDQGKLYRLWDDADKSRPFELANKALEVEELLRYNGDGSRMEREFWLEAIAPSEKPAASFLEFSFKNRLNDDKEFLDKIAITALGIKDIKFEAVNNGLKDDDTELDIDPNWPVGLDDKAYRVFPGRKWEGDQPTADAKNIVKVKATLTTEPVRSVPLYFRSFDIDDPQENFNDLDDEADEEDNRGGEQRKEGRFVATDDDILKLDFDKQEEFFEFMVTFYPGDNFRIAGSGDKNFLGQLENDDVKMLAASKRPPTWIIDRHVFAKTENAAKALLPEHEAYMSDVLTVWRKMYLEVDTMGEVVNNEVTATVEAVRLDEVRDNGYSVFELQLSENLFSKLPVKPKEYSLNSNGQIVAWQNAYYGGLLTLNGVVYQVRASSGYPPPRKDTVLVSKGPVGWAPLSVANEGDTISMVDDDAYKNGDKVPSVPLDRLEIVFKPAYVLPTADKVPNKRKTAPFLLNYEGDTSTDLTDSYAFDNEKWHEEPEIWVVYLLAGFQGIMREDRDGNSDRGAIAGQADGDKVTFLGGKGAVIFMESGRELEKDYPETDAEGKPTGKLKKGWRLIDAPPHEIGHLFGAKHTESGLMSDQDATKSDEFGIETLRRIRARPNP